MRSDAANGRPALAGVLDQLYERTGKRIKTVTRAGSAGLYLMAAGPYLSWLSLTFLERLPGHPLKPLPVAFGTLHHRTGMVSRRSADDMSPYGLFPANCTGRGRPHKMPEPGRRYVPPVPPSSRGVSTRAAEFMQ